VVQSGHRVVPKPEAEPALSWRNRKKARVAGAECPEEDQQVITERDTGECG
jgi:hypothetical protein